MDVRLIPLHGRLDRVEVSLHERLDRAEVSLLERLDDVEAPLYGRLDQIEGSFRERLDRVDISLLERLNQVDALVGHVANLEVSVRNHVEARLAILEAHVADRNASSETRLHQIETRLHHIEAQLHRVSTTANDLQAQWRVYVPSFVGAIAAVKRTGTDIGALSSRLDAVSASLPAERNLTAEVVEAGTFASTVEMATLEERVSMLEGRLSTHAENLTSELSAGAQELNTTLSARIRSVVDQTDALEDQLMNVRHSLSNDMTDLWQFVRAQTAHGIASKAEPVD
ncbi:MAG: hypothetical protein PW843_09410 [Azospirillaceae bacterium]|nr:hypothetical protein [Azospirillaceae bacterium]